MGKVRKAKNHTEKSNGRKKKKYRCLNVWTRNPDSVGLHLEMRVACSWNVPAKPLSAWVELKSKHTP